MASALFIVVLTAACAAPERSAEAFNADARGSLGGAVKPEKHVHNETLPPNQRFASLDRYLFYLRTQVAPTDGAWYKEIRPGVYELQTGNARRLRDLGEAPPAAEKKIYTRAELMKLLGFSR